MKAPAGVDTKRGDPYSLERTLPARHNGGQRGRRRAAARARRALLGDLVAAAILAGIVLALSPGLGVVAWFGLPLLLLGTIWIGLERSARRRRRRAARARRVS